jgi:hypothetical protein
VALADALDRASNSTVEIIPTAEQGASLATAQAS